MPNLKLGIWSCTNGPHKIRDLPSPPRATKGDGSKTEFATPATACQECETRCQKARWAACRPTHKATRTANRRPARQRHRHGSGWQARAGVLSRRRRPMRRQASGTGPAALIAASVFNRSLVDLVAAGRADADVSPAAEVLTRMTKEAETLLRAGVWQNSLRNNRPSQPHGRHADQLLRKWPVMPTTEVAGFVETVFRPR